MYGGTVLKNDDNLLALVKSLQIDWCAFFKSLHLPGGKLSCGHIKGSKMNVSEGW